MSAREVNFSFNGLHCMRDFGCIFIEAGKSRIVTPPLSRNAYEIAGVSGTVLLGDEAVHQPYKLSGYLVPMECPASMTDAQALARRISTWLKCGRAELCWDYEPLQMHLAEVSAATSWDTGVWMDGGLSVEFIVQPGTYDLLPTCAQAEIAGAAMEILLPVSTDLPAPVNIEITNTGDTAITGVMITAADGSCVQLGKGIEIPVGGILRINMEPPIGAQIITGESVESALRYALRFDQLLVRGPEALEILVNGQATVRATARGCML